MIHVVFDDPIGGSLRHAIDPETGKRISDADIVIFNWMLDIGYLKPGIRSKYRKQLPGKMIMNSEFIGDKEGIPQIGVRNNQNLTRLVNEIKAGADIKVWYSSAPDNMCGFYYLCTIFKKYPNNRFFVSEAPKFVHRKRGDHIIHGWGAFEPEELAEFIHLQRQIENSEIKTYAKVWKQLTEENAILRAVISGFPASVDENFYDPFIDRFIPSEDPIRESEVIGNVMEHYEFGVSDCWYEYRIQSMIDKGSLRVIEIPDEHPMRRIIQRCSV